MPVEESRVVTRGTFVLTRARARRELFESRLCSFGGHITTAIAHSIVLSHHMKKAAVLLKKRRKGWLQCGNGQLRFAASLSFLRAVSCSMHEVRKELFLKQVTTTEPARATKKTVHQSYRYHQSYDAREKDGLRASESAYSLASCNALAASASASLLPTSNHKGEKTTGFRHTGTTLEAALLSYIIAVQPHSNVLHASEEATCITKPCSAFIIILIWHSTATMCNVPLCVCTISTALRAYLHTHYCHTSGEHGSLLSLFCLPCILVQAFYCHFCA